MGNQNLDEEGSVDDVDEDDVRDHLLFSISTAGVLSFESAPDYETPLDGVDGQATRDNKYHVVVQASDRGSMNQHNWFKVTVSVTNVDETGEVTWEVDPDATTGAEGANDPEPRQRLLQFQPGATLYVAVTDEDLNDDGSGATWQWFRGQNDTGPWTPIAGVTGAEYTLKDAPADPNDVDQHIRAEASYGGKTADFVTPNPVQRARVDANTSPVFPSTTVTRTMAENTAAGTNIGAAVEANDLDGDILIYSLVENVDDDSGRFEIDEATGRLTVRQPLDHEATGNEDSVAGSNVYTVVVRATDSSGADTGEAGVDATVTITVTDINESPSVTGSGMVNDHREDAVVMLMTGDDTTTEWLATASDPEEGNIDWSLSGADMDMFKLTGMGNADGSMRGLEFKAKPDFEDPKDANTDNIYEVTVVVSDGSAKNAERPVTVKVIDSDELGEVKLSTQNPVVGVEIIATPSDSDTYVNNVSWVWHRLDMRVAGTELALPEVPETNPFMLGPIAGATSNMYTPVAADVGRYLVAVVDYLDRTFHEDPDGMIVEPETFIGFSGNGTRSAVTTAVLTSPTNVSPKFGEGATTVRLVAENTVPVAGDPDAANIGDQIVARDPDGPDDALSYSLAGVDESSFELSGNQIRVRAGDDAQLRDQGHVLRYGDCEGWLRPSQ